MNPALSVFLHAPRLGTVKSRLAAEVGDRQALRLYRIMAARTLAAARGAGLEVTVWFAPADAGPEMRYWLGEECQLRPQASGDRGARLAVAARAADPRRAWLAIVGDCPSLTAAIVREAAQITQRGQFVIGPTTDGEYYLLGGMPPIPDLFTAMPWGTSRLLAETRARLAHVGAVWRELTPLRVVDTMEHARAERLLT
ncbi:MAG TPA: TIGR04282 family arsenosugar biosynthesis glycosyltransferase [Gemmatimonadales bacterium]